MRIFKIVLIIILSIMAVSVTAVMVLIMSGKIDLKNLHIGIDDISEKVVFDKTYDKLFDDIKIDTEAAKIEILNSDDDSVKVTVYDDYEMTKVTDTDNNLNINIKTKKCNFICFRVKEAHVVIYIPTNYDKKITINNEYGDSIVKSLPNAMNPVQINAKTYNCTLPTLINKSESSLSSEFLTVIPTIRGKKKVPMEAEKLR